MAIGFLFLFFAFVRAVEIPPRRGSRRFTTENGLHVGLRSQYEEMTVSAIFPTGALMTPDEHFGLEFLWASAVLHPLKKLQPQLNGFATGDLDGRFALVARAPLNAMNNSTADAEALLSAFVRRITDVKPQTEIREAMLRMAEGDVVPSTYNPEGMAISDLDFMMNPGSISAKRYKSWGATNENKVKTLLGRRQRGVTEALKKFQAALVAADRMLLTVEAPLSLDRMQELVTAAAAEVPEASSVPFSPPHSVLFDRLGIVADSKSCNKNFRVQSVSPLPLDLKEREAKLVHAEAFGQVLGKALRKALSLSPVPELNDKDSVVRVAIDTLPDALFIRIDMYFPRSAAVDIEAMALVASVAAAGRALPPSKTYEFQRLWEDTYVAGGLSSAQQLASTEPELAEDDSTMSALFGAIGSANSVVWTSHSVDWKHSGLLEQLKNPQLREIDSNAIFSFLEQPACPKRREPQRAEAGPPGPYVSSPEDAVIQWDGFGQVPNHTRIHITKGQLAHLHHYHLPDTRGSGMIRIDFRTPTAFYAEAQMLGKVLGAYVQRTIVREINEDCHGGVTAHVNFGTQHSVFAVQGPTAYLLDAMSRVLNATYSSFQNCYEPSKEVYDEMEATRLELLAAQKATFGMPDRAETSLLETLWGLPSARSVMEALEEFNSTNIIPWLRTRMRHGLLAVFVSGDINHTDAVLMTQELGRFFPRTQILPQSLTWNQMLIAPLGEKIVVDRMDAVDPDDPYPKLASSAALIKQIGHKDKQRRRYLMSLLLLHAQLLPARRHNPVSHGTKLRNWSVYDNPVSFVVSTSSEEHTPTEQLADIDRFLEHLRERVVSASKEQWEAHKRMVATLLMPAPVHFVTSWWTAGSVPSDGYANPLFDTELSFGVRHHFAHQLMKLKITQDDVAKFFDNYVKRGGPRARVVQSKMWSVPHRQLHPDDVERSTFTEFDRTDPLCKVIPPIPDKVVVKTDWDAGQVFSARPLFPYVEALRWIIFGQIPDNNTVTFF